MLSNAARSVSGGLCLYIGVNVRVGEVLRHEAQHFLRVHGYFVRGVDFGAEEHGSPTGDIFPVAEVEIKSARLEDEEYCRDCTHYVDGDSRYINRNTKYEVSACSVVVDVYETKKSVRRETETTNPASELWFQPPGSVQENAAQQ